MKFVVLEISQGSHCAVQLFYGFHFSNTNKKHQKIPFFNVSGYMVQPELNYKESMMAWG